MDNWTAKEYHIKFKNEMGFERAPKYLAWLRKRFPGKVLHHLLGSTSRRLKFTDYLVVPVDPLEEHREADANRAIHFMYNLPRAIKNLIEYVQFLEAVEK